MLFLPSCNTFEHYYNNYNCYRSECYISDIFTVKCIYNNDGSLEIPDGPNLKTLQILQQQKYFTQTVYHRYIRGHVQKLRTYLPTLK